MTETVSEMLDFVPTLKLLKAREDPILLEVIEFSIDLIIQPRCGPGVDSSYERSDFQESALQ
jgi:hypothetical protein